MGNQERAQLLIVKGTISELPKNQQEIVNECYQKLSKIITEYNEKSEGMGYLGIALVATEITASEE